MEGVDVSFINAGLWKQFSTHHTEMIITRAGRNMFPSVQLQVKGLIPTSLYCIKLQFDQVSPKLKYQKGSWIVANNSEQVPLYNVYQHPESPNYGEHWMKSKILFNKLKISNNKEDQENSVPLRVYLNSLHKYRIRLVICNAEEGMRIRTPICSYYLPHAEFIAVTAYQNRQVTELKVLHNPYAKAFRNRRDRRSNEKMTTVGQRRNGYNEERDGINNSGMILWTGNEQYSPNQSHQMSTSSLTPSASEEESISSSPRYLAFQQNELHINTFGNSVTGFHPPLINPSQTHLLELQSSPFSSLPTPPPPPASLQSPSSLHFPPHADRNVPCMASEYLQRDFRGSFSPERNPHCDNCFTHSPYHPLPNITRIGQWLPPQTQNFFTSSSTGSSSFLHPHRSSASGNFGHLFPASRLSPVHPLQHLYAPKPDMTSVNDQNDCCLQPSSSEMQIDSARTTANGVQVSSATATASGVQVSSALTSVSILDILLPESSNQTQP